jgi:hypothetical protein
MKQCLYGHCNVVECGENECGYFKEAPWSEVGETGIPQRPSVWPANNLIKESDTSPPEKFIYGTKSPAEQTGREPLPEGISREEAIQGLKDVVATAEDHERETDPEFVRFPTLHALLEYIEAHGFPGRGSDLALGVKPATLKCPDCRYWENDMCDRKDAVCGLCTNETTIRQVEIDQPVGLRTIRHFGCVNGEPLDK